MLNQTFNPEELSKLVTDKEISNFKLGNNEQDILKSVTSISYNISESDFTFSSLKKRIHNDKEIYSVESKDEYFAIKKINSVLKRIYLTKFASRDDILKHVTQIIGDGSEYFVMRADIKSFYESVPRSKVITKIKNDSFLGSLMIKKLAALDKALANLKCKTLPRGLSISATLSELYLKNFDDIMKNTRGVYYYARYVDDIVIVCSHNHLEIEDKLRNQLGNLGLSTNHKFEVVNTQTASSGFDFLGVRFEFSAGQCKFLLPKTKVKRLKSKIIDAILDYSKRPNCVLLHDRIKILTGNYRLYTKTHSNNLKGGIYYSNQHLTDFHQLNELNTFLRKSLTATKGSLSKKSMLIPPLTVKHCLSECFFKGYMNKELKAVDSNMAEIMRCWKRAK